MATENKKDDNNIKVLTDYQHTRLRSPIYLGSNNLSSEQLPTYKNGKPEFIETEYVQGRHVANKEIWDNILDRYTKNYGSFLKVIFDEKTHITIMEDDADGIPIDFNEEHQEYTATLAIAHLRAGSNFINEGRGVNRGQNGVGASVVNFCSEYFILEIHRDNKKFVQKFSEGETELNIEPPVITPYKGTKTGTKITFKLSEKVFPCTTLSEDFVRSRLIEIALFYPNLKVYFNGERINVKTVEKTLFEGYSPVSIEIVKEGVFNGKYWIVPEYFEDGSDRFHSVVNGMMVPYGVHIEAFKSGFYSGLLTALEKESKKRKLNPNKSDISDGMFVFNMSEVHDAVFGDQAKTTLKNEKVRNVIKSELDDPEFFKKLIKKFPNWIDRIYERCKERTHKSDAKDIANAAKKMRKKVEELEDAASKNRSECILHICEGKSAVSGLTESRVPDYHAAYPIRGKLLNCYGVSPKKALENEVVSKLLSVIGLVPGQRVVRENLRYGSIRITTDADYDGAAICSLILNMLYTYFPELFDPEQPPFVYVFLTPLIVAENKKERLYWFSDDVCNFNPSQYKGYTITRNKGLAGLTKEIWKDVLANPRLLPIVEEDGKLGEMLKLFFSDDVEARKKWMGIQAE